MSNIQKLGLGTVQFGSSYGISNTRGQTPSAEVTKILNVAKNNNIEMLDSASAYGNAEEVLGKNSLKKFKIVSKYLPSSMGKGVILQFNQTLKNLNVSRLYGYLAHRPLEILKFPGEWDDLQELKANEKVRKIGFSLNEPFELEALLNENFYPDIVQVPFNYFDRRFEQALINLREIGCEIHTRSTFLQGLFFINPNSLDNYFDEVKPLLFNLQENNPMLPGRLLKFVLDQPLIDKVIIGVENEDQLLLNLQTVQEAAILEPLNKRISDNILIPSRWPKK